jgi:cysteine-rich repeat protein
MLRRAWPRITFVFPLFACLGCPSDVDDLFNDDPGRGGGGSGPSGGDNSGPGAGTSDGGNPSSGGAPQGAGPQGGNPNPNGGSGEGGAPGFCGDGVLDPGEQCDGNDLGFLSCLDQGFTQAQPGVTQCNGSCNPDYSQCESTCDGIGVEPGESCDGDDLEGFDCTDFGSDDPAGLACLDDCTGFSTANCSGDCGNGAVESGEQCDDGGNTSGDGCSATCVAEGLECANAIPVALGFGTQQFTGDTSAGSTTFSTTDAGCAAGAAGRSRVYAVTAGDDGFLTAWLDRTGTGFDSVLYARTGCADDTSTIICADNSVPLSPTPNFGGDVLSFPVTAGQTVYLVVDSPSLAAQGAYALGIDLSLGSNCTDPIPLPVWSGSPQTVLGFTNNQTMSGGGSCGGGGMGNGASDVVYRVERFTNTITEMDFELPEALATFDSILYARFDCGSNEIECDDSVAPTGGESLSLMFVNNNIRYLWVDGYLGAEGSYGLTVTPSL